MAAVVPPPPAAASAAAAVAPSPGVSSPPWPAAGASSASGGARLWAQPGGSTRRDGALGRSPRASHRSLLAEDRKESAVEVQAAEHSPKDTCRVCCTAKSTYASMQAKASVACCETVFTAMACSTQVPNSSTASVCAAMACCSRNSASWVRFSLLRKSKKFVGLASASQRSRAALSVAAARSLRRRLSVTAAAQAWCFTRSTSSSACLRPRSLRTERSKFCSGCWRLPHNAAARLMRTPAMPPQASKTPWAAS
mmetsp:Transcript_43747/g.140295  ORF Transcript_43747/g.140295 Transcript_43747/m.140295 type:complete len:253 (+) Transcript_43747:1337-2095(+)